MHKYCKFGDRCKFLHPRLCENFENGKCNAKKCDFYHAPGGPKVFNAHRDKHSRNENITGGESPLNSEPFFIDVLNDLHQKMEFLQKMVRHQSQPQMAPRMNYQRRPHLPPRFMRSPHPPPMYR